MIGQRVGSYEITHKLAEGGMGAVYVAHHDLMQRDAVVKVLLPAYSEKTNMVKRFFNEARAAASIHHPGIVEVYDLGFMSDGRAYIVMEKLRGETLTARLAREGRLSVEHATTFVLHIASALDAAHKAGIIHRDLKPDNLFVVPDPGVAGGERIKVVDFGIAKLQVNPGSLATQAGSIFGTPAYMAPEQCSDAATVDGRADIYAIGCLFYELLCGDPPFGKTGGVALLAAQLRDTPPPPRQHNPAIPQHIENVILRALDKDPDARYASCAELARDLGVRSGELEAVAGSPSTSAPPTEDAYAPTMAPPQQSSLAYQPTGVSTPEVSEPPALTTHSAASGQMASPAPSEMESWAPTDRNRKGLYAAIAAGVVVVGGIVAFAAFSGGGGKTAQAPAIDAAPARVASATVDAASVAAPVDASQPTALRPNSAERNFDAAVTRKTASGKAAEGAKHPTRRKPGAVAAVKPKPKPKLTPQQLLAQAQRAAVRGQYGKSLQLCTKAWQRRRTAKAVGICGLAACRLRRKTLARRWLNRVRRPAIRRMIRIVCNQNGINLARPRRRRPRAPAPGGY